MIKELPSILSEFIGIADSLQLFYWVKNGTLLGLVRDGGIMPWDHDVDIAVWEGQQDKLERLIAIYKTRGFNVQVRSYHKEIYKLKLFLNTSDYGKLDSIDIDVFYKTGKWVWARQYWRGLYDPDTPDNAVSRFLKKAISYVVLQWYESRERTDVAFFVYRKVLRFIVWTYPAELLKEFVFIDRIRIPKEASAVLERSYGDWRVPRREWNFLKDDGSLVFKSPERFILEDCTE